MPKLRRRPPKYSSSSRAAASSLADAHESAGRGGQQQRADGRVDGTVRDVEQALALGRLLEPAVQPRQRVVVGGCREKVVEFVHDGTPPG
jgi:hypothetical protein